MKKITVLGSTGSIGTQTLDVVDRQNDKFEVCGLAANRNVKLLSEKIRKYKPQKAAIFDETLYNELKTSVSDCSTEILCGSDGVREVAARTGADVALSAIVGIAGLLLLICTIISPILQILAFSFGLKFVSAVIEPVTDERISSFLASVSKHVNMLIVSILAVAFMYFICVMLLIFTSNAFF